jgi:hypothetical protein
VIGAGWHKGFDRQDDLVGHLLQELSMPFGIPILLRAEYDDYPNALRSHDQRNRAVRSNPFDYVVLFDLELKLSFQIPSHNWFLVLKYPSMMACFAVQHYTNTIEAIRTAAIVGDEP